MKFNLLQFMLFFIALLTCILAGSQIGVHFGKYFKLLNIVCFIIILFLSKNHKYPGTFVLIMLFLLILSNFYGLFFGKYDLNVLNLGRFSFVLFIISLFNKKIIETILDYYSKMILFLVVASLFFWPISIFYPGIIKSLPFFSYGDLATQKYYNAILYTASSHFDIGDFRNRSIFWEPNVFAVNMSISFAWLAFYRRKLNIGKYLIFLFGFVSSLSTSGIFLFIIASFALLIKKNTIISTSNKIVMLLIVISTIFFLYMHYGDLFYQFLIMKFSLNDPLYGYSFRGRLLSFDRAAEILINNPFLGVGLTNHLIMTNSFTGMVYQLGLPFTFIYMIFNSYIFKSMGLFLFFPFYLLLIFSQHFFFTDLYILLTSVGLHYKDIKIFNKYNVTLTSAT